jgi:hypothetical protein
MTHVGLMPLAANGGTIVLSFRGSAEVNASQGQPTRATP